MPAVAKAISSNINSSSFISVKSIGYGTTSLLISSGVGYSEKYITGATANEIGPVGGVGKVGKGEPHNTTDQSSLPGGYDSAYRKNKTSPVAPIPLVYGTRRVGGPLAYANVLQLNRLHMINCVSIGPISGVGLIQINDLPWDALDDNGQDRFPGFYAEDKTGTYDQNAFPGLMAATSEWTEEHRLRGIAAIHTAHKGGAGKYKGIPTITAEVMGRLIYDPRDGEFRYSANPALVIRDYLTNQHYGFAYLESSIDDESVILAANYLDAISVECHAVVDTSRNLDDNLALMLGSCRGMLIYSLGSYVLKIDKPEISSFIFNEENMLGNLGIGFFNSSSRINKAKVTWINPAYTYEPDVLPIDIPIFEIEDGGQVNLNEIDLPFTTSIDTAFRIGLTEIKQSRIDVPSLEFTTFESALALTVGDVVTIDNPAISPDPMLMRVAQLTVNQDHTIDIAAVGYDDDAYGIGPTPDVPVSGDSTIPDSLTVSPPTNLTFEESTFGVLGTGILSWDLNVDDNFTYQISYKERGIDFWSDITITPNDRLDIVNLAVGTYDVRVVAVNSLGGMSPPVVVEGAITQAAVMPRVSGLELAGESGNALIFDEPDANFYWRDASQTGSYQLGSEPTGGNSGSRDGYFSHYYVRIGYYTSPTDFVVVRDEETQNNHYSYTYAKNVKDGGPRREFVIRVTQVGNQGQESPKITELVVSNPAPEVPDNVRITPLYGRIDIETVVQDNVTDFAYLRVWQSKVPGFDPSLVEPNVMTKDTYVSIPGDVNSTYYLRIAYVDTFGPSTLNYSEEYVTTVLAIPDTVPPAKPINLALTQGGSLNPEGINVPAIIATWDKVTDTDLQSYGWEIQEGSETPVFGVCDKADNPSYEFSPVTSSSSYSIRVRSVDTSGNESDYTDLELINIAGDTIAPGPVTNLQARSQLRGVLLSWDPPSDLDLDSYQIWEATNNNFANAQLVGSSAKSPFTRNDLEANNVRYYWVKAVDKSGNIGPFNSANGTVATVGMLFTNDVPNQLIETHMVKNFAIGTAQIANSAIGTAQINDLAVGTAQIGNLAVGSLKIAGDAVITDKILDDAVTEIVSNVIDEYVYLNDEDTVEIIHVFIDTIGKIGFEAVISVTFALDAVNPIFNTGLLVGSGAQYLRNSEVLYNGGLLTSFNISRIIAPAIFVFTESIPSNAITRYAFKVTNNVTEYHNGTLWGGWDPLPVKLGVDDRRIVVFGRRK